MGVHLGIKSIRIEAGPIAVHEMTLQFHVPELVQVHPRRYDLVVDVISGQAGVGLIGTVEDNVRATSGNGGDRITGVIGANGKPLDEAIGPRDIPTTHIDDGLDVEGLVDLIMKLPAIFGIDVQLAYCV